MDERGRKIVKDLFEYYNTTPGRMPKETYNKYKEASNSLMVIVDYISGMTDRYAVEQHNKIFSWLND